MTDGEVARARGVVGWRVGVGEQRGQKSWKREGRERERERERERVDKESKRKRERRESVNNESERRKDEETKRAGVGRSTQREREPKGTETKRKDMATSFSSPYAGLAFNVLDTSPSLNSKLTQHLPANAGYLGVHPLLLHLPQARNAEPFCDIWLGPAEDHRLDADKVWKVSRRSGPDHPAS